MTTDKTLAHPTHEATAKFVRIKTINADECVVIWLKTTAHDPLVEAWCGVVVAIDPVAIRLDVAWNKIDVIRSNESGIRVIPWARVGEIQIVDPALNRTRS